MPANPPLRIAGNEVQYLEIQNLHLQYFHVQAPLPAVKTNRHTMLKVLISRKRFLQDRQGRTFADVLNDPQQPFDEVLAFFSDGNRQRRMEEAETHHDRPPLAGVVRELESQPAIAEFLASQDARRAKRLRQAVGVVVRMIMERRGWRKTGRKGSLGVRASLSHPASPTAIHHNTGGLAFWFLRAERYELLGGMPFSSVRKRRQEAELQSSPQRPSSRQNSGP